MQNTREIGEIQLEHVREFKGLRIVFNNEKKKTTRHAVATEELFKILRSFNQNLNQCIQNEI